MHLHTFVDRERKHSKNGDEGVVLVVIQITGDPSAERTAPPRSTHVQPGDASHAFIQQGERERLMKTPSSSSTTAWWWWRSVAIPQGFAKHHGRGEGLGRGGGLRQGKRVAPMRLPTIYRGGGGWFLALQVHWGVGKGGGKKSHHFPSPPIVIPPF